MATQKNSTSATQPIEDWATALEGHLDLQEDIERWHQRAHAVQGREEGHRVLTAAVEHLVRRYQGLWTKQPAYRAAIKARDIRHRPERVVEDILYQNLLGAIEDSVLHGSWGTPSLERLTDFVSPMSALRGGVWGEVYETAADSTSEPGLLYSGFPPLPEDPLFGHGSNADKQLASTADLQSQHAGGLIRWEALGRHLVVHLHIAQGATKEEFENATKVLWKQQLEMRVAQLDPAHGVPGYGGYGGQGSKTPYKKHVKLYNMYRDFFREHPELDPNKKKDRGEFISALRR